MPSRKTKLKPVAKIQGIKSMPSVKVMRSYDYCHFEVALSTNEEMTVQEIDALRKQAALLVDEAIRQYRIAKEKEERRQSREFQKRIQLEKMKAIESKPKGEWTPDEAALMRAYKDDEFWKDFDEEDYNYYDPDREHHFSMLRHFDGVVVKP